MHHSSREPSRDKNQNDLNEMQSLLQGFSQGSDKLFNKLVDIAKNASRKNDRTAVASALQSCNIQSTQKNIQRLIKAIEQYRENHPRERQQIRSVKVENEGKEAKQTAREERKAFINLAREGLSITCDQYHATVQEALEGVEALHPIKIPYFGLKCESNLRETPLGLERPEQIIKQAGHTLSEIVDHLLIARSTSNLSHIGAVLKLFPLDPNNQGLLSRYRIAIQEVDRLLRNPPDSEVWEMIDHSAQRIGALCKQNKIFNIGWLFNRSPKHPYADRQGDILEIGAGFRAAHYFHGLQKTTPLHVVAPDPWEAEVLRQATPDSKKGLITIHDFEVSSLPLDRYYQTIRFNGDRTLHNPKELESVPHLSALLQREGKLVIDFSSIPTNRFVVGQGDFRAILKNLIEQGSFELSCTFGQTKMAEVPGSLKRLFYPVNFQTRDLILLTKKSAIDKNQSLDLAQNICDYMETLALFQDPTHWNFLISAIESREEIFKLARSFNLEIDKEDFSTEDLKEAERLLNKCNFESLAKHVTSRGIFAGPYGMGRENFKDSAFSDLGRMIGGFGSKFTAT